MKSKRLDHIDFMEMLAIFFVVFYHITLYDYNFLADGALLPYIRYFPRSVLSLCVPIFFFANGYLLLSKPLNIKKHVFKILRLAILTVAWGIITVLLNQVIRGEYFSLLDIGRIARCWSDNWINHLWYMGVLLCIYIAFPIIKRIYDNKYLLFVLLAVVLAICTFGVKAFNLLVICARFLFSDSDVALSFLERIAVFDIHRERFAYTAVYFFIGGIAYRYEREIMKISAAKRNAIASVGLLLFSSLLFIIGILCSRAQGYVWDIVWCGYDTLFTCAGLICLYILSLSVVRERRFVTAVSKNTLGIYFIHPILISFLLPKLIKLEWMRNIPMNIIAATLVLLASLGLSLALSKIPILSRLVK